MTAILAFLTTQWKLPQWLAEVVLIASAFLLALGVIGGVKIAYDRAVVSHHEEKIVQRAQPATDEASKQRAQDTINIAQHEQEVHNAVAAQPDQPIAPTSRVRACDQLRRAGRSVPACS